jgi:hypothetical protein
VSAIYRKSFVLSNRARQESTIGEIVNYQSSDAQRIGDVYIQYHLIWSSMFQMIGKLESSTTVVIDYV